MQARFPEKNSGFTLIEVLIVIVVSVVLSTIAIGYSGIGRNQIALSVEATKVSQFILQARSLSIATYGTGTSTCAYGVAFNAAAGTYSIFGYAPLGTPPAPCPGATSTNVLSLEKEYTDGTWNVHLQNGVVMSATSSDSLSAVLFYPPDPKTFFVCAGACVSSGKVYLSTADGSMSRTISVNSAGQVNF
jgi:prepilin-type N-terminal cleavage/methylation domain-containing protein